MPSKKDPPAWIAEHARSLRDHARFKLSELEVGAVSVEHPSVIIEFGGEDPNRHELDCFYSPLKTCSSRYLIINSWLPTKNQEEIYTRLAETLGNTSLLTELQIEWQGEDDGRSLLTLKQKLNYHSGAPTDEYTKKIWNNIIGPIIDINKP